MYINAHEPFNSTHLLYKLMARPHIELNPLKLSLKLTESKSLIGP